MDRDSSVPMRHDGGLDRDSSVTMRHDGGLDRDSSVPRRHDGGLDRDSSVPMRHDGGLDRDSSTLVRHAGRQVMASHASLRDNVGVCVLAYRDSKPTPRKLEHSVPSGKLTLATSAVVPVKALQPLSGDESHPRVTVST